MKEVSDQLGTKKFELYTIELGINKLYFINIYQVEVRKLICGSNPLVRLHFGAGAGWLGATNDSPRFPLVDINEVKIVST